MSELPQLHLGEFMPPASICSGEWHYPGVYPGSNFNFAHLKSFAQKLEAAKFDAFIKIAGIDRYYRLTMLSRHSGLRIAYTNALAAPFK